MDVKNGDEPYENNDIPMDDVTSYVHYNEKNQKRFQKETK